MSNTDIKQSIQAALQPILDSKKAFLVDIQVRHERRGKLIQAFVDTDEGITIDMCADISRELNRLVVLDAMIDGPYSLEISSPGIDRPLKMLRQYRKNVGRKYKVTYKTDSELKTMQATLEDVSDDRLTFTPEQGEKLTLLFSQIIESKEELPW